MSSTLTWFALVQVTAFSRFARAFGYEDVEVSRLADFPQTASRTAHTATGQRAAFTRRGITFNQHRVFRTTGRELDLTPGFRAVRPLL